MNPTIFGVIGPGFLNQVPTLSRINDTGFGLLAEFRVTGFPLTGLGVTVLRFL